MTRARSAYLGDTWSGCKKSRFQVSLSKRIKLGRRLGRLRCQAPEREAPERRKSVAGSRVCWSRCHGGWDCLGTTGSLSQRQCIFRVGEEVDGWGNWSNGQGRSFRVEVECRRRGGGCSSSESVWRCAEPRESVGGWGSGSDVRRSVGVWRKLEGFHTLTKKRAARRWNELGSCIRSRSGQGRVGSWS